jgi:hypothetical protein
MSNEFRESLKNTTLQYVENIIYEGETVLTYLFVFPQIQKMTGLCKTYRI